MMGSCPVQAAIQFLTELSIHASKTGHSFIENALTHSAGRQNRRQRLFHICEFEGQTIPPESICAW